MTQKDPALTMTGDVAGTLRYMSPEQALGKRREMNYRTDIYSLGVTLYEFLTLQPAFAGENRETLVRRLLEDDPPRPRTVNRAIPRDLETIVLKAIAKEPPQRYASAQDLADDLKRFLADEPIRARRAGPVVRLKKWTKRHKAVTGVVAAVLLAVAIFGTVTAVQAYQRDMRLTVVATEGLADVRVAMAQKEFGQAQRRATELQAELAAAPKLKAQFGPELEDLMHQAEVRLRLQRFEKLAAEARFSAVRLLALPRVRDSAEVRHRCQEVLAVFHVLDNDRWLEDLERLPLERAEVREIKQSLVELLFLSAAVEVPFGDGAAGAHRAIALLDTVETLAPNLRVLYEYRGRCRAMLGDREAARSDSQRASTMQPNTWLDHYFRALELRPTNSPDALREAEAAITFRPDDYWSWYIWSEFQINRRDNDLWYWGWSICIRLRPDEPSAWISRARGWGGHDGLGAIADLSRALELTSDPALRTLTYKRLADHRLTLGQPEAALSDCNSAIRLDPRNAGAFLYRAWCYRELGQWEKARADARKAVELYEKRTDAQATEMRLTAFTTLGQPQDAVEVAVAMYNSEELRDWVRTVEGILERERIPQQDFALAMARWKLGDKDGARQWYEKGVQCTDKTQNKDLLRFLEDKDLPRLRDETAALLGIPVKPPAGKEKTGKG